MSEKSLTIKFGSHTYLTASNTNIKDGAICFVKDSNSSPSYYLSLKDNSTLYGIMPPPLNKTDAEIINIPLVSNGNTKCAYYNPEISLSKIKFCRPNDWKTSAGSIECANNSAITITLGATTANASGKINVYSSTESSYYTTITRKTGNLTATGTTIANNGTFYLPNNASSMYAVWSNSSSSAQGSAAKPVFVNGDGQVVACTPESVFGQFSSSTNTLTISVATKKRTAPIVNSISNTWTNGTTTGPTLKTTVNGVAGTAVAIPSATNAISGVVTTTTQTFAGAKTFNGIVSIANTTASSSSTTGSLRVSGGVGVAGSMYIGGGVDITSTLTVGSTMTIKDKIVGTLTKNYGPVLPTTNLTVGQIFFKFIS